MSGDIFTRHAASRNRVANNRARRRIFPEAPGGEARRIEIRWEEARRNSTKTVFLREDILSREYLLVTKIRARSVTSCIRKENGTEKRKGEKREKERRDRRDSHV